MERTLVLEAVRVTEKAALACAKFIGKGDEKSADQAAVDAMRQALNELSIQGTIVIGEGERDQAPMLYMGEKVGQGHGPEIDIAVDPLEGTTITARCAPNALSVMAFGEKGSLLKAPDVYMNKIVVGKGIAPDLLNLKAPLEENLKKLSQAKGKDISELLVCVLDRPRHSQMISKIRALGAGVMLIPDGDICASIATCLPESRVDLYLGIGGAPEGVITAAALKCLGGTMQGQLIFKTPEEIQKAAEAEIRDLDYVYGMEELAGGAVLFCATGVTDGTLLKGVQLFPEYAVSHSLILRSSTGTLRTLETYHRLACENMENRNFDPMFRQASGF